MAPENSDHAIASAVFNHKPTTAITASRYKLIRDFDRANWGGLRNYFSAFDAIIAAEFHLNNLSRDCSKEEKIH